MLEKLENLNLRSSSIFNEAADGKTRLTPAILHQGQLTSFGAFAKPSTRYWLLKSARS